MINNKDDLEYYIVSDMKSMGIYPLTLRDKLMGLLVPNRYQLQIKLRKLEYKQSIANQGIINRIIYHINAKQFERYCLRMGCEIPVGVFGPGLCINHTGGIVVNGNAKIGSNCRINAGVNIGGFGRFNESHTNTAPTIGNNAYIGPGAKIFGNIVIGDNVAIGANAVVLKDVPDNSTVVGVPGRIIVGKGSFDMLLYGDERHVPASLKA